MFEDVGMILQLDVTRNNIFKLLLKMCQNIMEMKTSPMEKNMLLSIINELWSE